MDIGREGAGRTPVASFSRSLTRTCCHVPARAPRVPGDTASGRRPTLLSAPKKSAGRAESEFAKSEVTLTAIAAIAHTG